MPQTTAQQTGTAQGTRRKGTEDSRRGSLPVFKLQRRLTNEESLRDRRWSTLVWNALVPAAQTDDQVTPYQVVQCCPSFCMNPRVIPPLTCAAQATPSTGHQADVPRTPTDAAASPEHTKQPETLGGVWTRAWRRKSSTPEPASRSQQKARRWTMITVGIMSTEAFNTCRAALLPQRIS